MLREEEDILYETGMSSFPIIDEAADEVESAELDIMLDGDDIIGMDDDDIEGLGSPSISIDEIENLDDDFIDPDNLVDDDDTVSEDLLDIEMADGEGDIVDQYIDDNDLDIEISDIDGEEE